MKDVDKESQTVTTASNRGIESRFSRGTSLKGSSGKSTESPRSSFGRSNTSIKDQAIIEKMNVAELFAEQKYIERIKAAEFEAESLRIQLKVEEAKLCAKVLDEETENENIEERRSDDKKTGFIPHAGMNKTRLCLTKQLQISSVNH